MTNGQLLWADDEMDLLTAHVLFLEKKGYEVTLVSNGNDAIDECQQRTYDLVILDEMMPGLSGLQTLQRIKELQPATPIILVTKSEEEDIMDQAIGSKIADYLIKPVNPNQILLSLKKNIHRKEIESTVTQSGYQQHFAQIAAQIQLCDTIDQWKDIYKTLVRWELELSPTSPMAELLATQIDDANAEFAKYIRRHYLTWVNPATFHSYQRPIMSTDIFRTKVFPHRDNNEKVFLIVVDNLRLDQWRLLAQELSDNFAIEEDIYLSILPTATQYARNAIFSGLMPDKIEKLYPDLWVDEDDDEGKNLNEAPLIATQLQRYRRKDTFAYNKVNDSQGAEKFLAKYHTLEQYDINVLVVNFIDMLSHARTESKMVRELANNESAYRAITLSWFQHSVLANLFTRLANSNYTIILTTDHGSIRATKPIKIIGDRNTNTNLRYKLGRNLNCDAKEIFTIRQPSVAQLPAPTLSTSYVFATGTTFFAYPNNYNYYVSYYKNTFQHGGISLQEMLIPLITLTPKKR